MMNTPKIWVPKFKIIEPASELPVSNKMKGEYMLRRIGPDGKIREETPWFDNLILDNGLNRLGSSREVLTLCAVGTGNTAPAITDTALASLLASTNGNNLTSDTVTIGVTPYGVQRTNTYRFAQGAAAGNLAEVGIGWLSNQLFSRALIEDGAGNPTTLTVQADEFLDVIYRVTVFPPLADVTGTIDISGTMYDYTMRAAGVNSANFWNFDTNYDDLFLSGLGGNSRFENFAYDGAIGATIENVPAGTSTIASSGSANGTYVNNSHERDFSVVWGLSDANYVGGITSFMVVVGDDSPAGLFSFQIEHGPAIPKQDTEVLTLNYTHTWARA